LKLNAVINKIGIISTFPPTQCGIATYASDIIYHLKCQYPLLEINKFELTNNQNIFISENLVTRSDNTEDFIKLSEFINSSDIDLLDIQHEFKIYGKPDGENINTLLENVKKPIATTLHTVSFDMSESREDIFRKIIIRSNLLFVFSEEAKNLIINKYKIIEAKIIVIPHGTPTVPFRLPNKIERRKDFLNDIIFVSSGHMRETKGYDIAIEALNIIKNVIGNFHYYIIGADHPQNETAQKYREKLIKLINEFDLNDKVTFINNYLSQKELIDFIQLADICLLPYTRKEQSSSGVLALMVACGRPIISTPFQFAKTQISKKSGVISESMLAVDFAKAIKSLIDRKNNWDEIMQYNHVLGQTWNWTSIVKQYYDCYKKIKLLK